MTFSKVYMKEITFDMCFLNEAEDQSKIKETKPLPRPAFGDYSHYFDYWIIKLTHGCSRGNDAERQISDHEIDCFSSSYEAYLLICKESKLSKMIDDHF